MIDAAGRPGAEASAQNAGMIRRLGEDAAERQLAQRTFERLSDLGEDWADLAPSRRTGALLALAHDPSHLHDAVAWLRLQGGRVEACDRPADIAPILAGSRLLRAWYLPDARVADAHALLTGFLLGIRRAGGTISCGLGATRLRVQNGRCVGVDTPDGPLHAERVVLAAGAWSATLAGQAGLVRPLFPLRRAIVLTTPHPLSRPEHPWTWIDDGGIYVRPETGAWLGSACDEAIDWPSTAPGSQGHLTAWHRALFLDKVQHHLPALLGAQPHRGWTGLRTFAPDRRPVLGRDPELEGLWWAAGLGGFGVSTCLAVGETVANWMLDRRVAWLDPRAVSPGRHFLSRWPIRPDGQLHRPRLVDSRLPRDTARA